MLYTQGGGAYIEPMGDLLTLNSDGGVGLEPSASALRSYGNSYSSGSSAAAATVCDARMAEVFAMVSNADKDAGVARAIISWLFDTQTPIRVQFTVRMRQLAPHPGRLLSLVTDVQLSRSACWTMQR